MAARRAAAVPARLTTLLLSASARNHARTRRPARAQASRLRRDSGAAVTLPASPGRRLPCLTAERDAALQLDNGVDRNSVQLSADPPAAPHGRCSSSSCANGVDGCGCRPAVTAVAGRGARSRGNATPQDTPHCVADTAGRHWAAPFVGGSEGGSQAATRQPRAVSAPGRNAASDR